MSWLHRTAVLAILLPSACHKSAPAPEPAPVAAPSPMDLAQAPKPEVANSGPPTLPFSIVKTLFTEGTTPVPVKADTTQRCFDAQTPHGARFTFCLLPHRPLTPEAQFVEGSGTLSVPSSADAVTLANEVAATFHVSPPPAPKAHAHDELRMRLQLIGENVDCTPSVGCNDHGTWTASKLLLGGGDIEVFFNWDVPGKRGEIVEASPDDDVALTGILSAL